MNSCVRSDAKCELCRQLGADLAVNYITTDFVAAVLHLSPLSLSLSLSLSPVSLLFLAPSPLRTPSLSHVMVMDVSLGEWVCRCVL
jgi:hypothetical protein